MGKVIASRAVGIDIGSGHVKVVVLRRKAGRLQVAGVGSSALPAKQENGQPPDAPAMTRAIRNALDAVGVRRTEAMCGMPRQSTAVRTMRLPGAPSESLAQAALLDTQQTLPFTAAQTVAGAHLQALPETEETVALLGAARGELVSLYRQAAAAAGVRLSGLGISSLAAATVIPANATAPWLLLDIGANATAMEVVLEGASRLSRVAMLGGEKLTQAFAADLGVDEETAEERKRAAGLNAFPGEGSESLGAETEEWLSRLIAEVRLLLAAYAAQGGSEPAVVRLMGGGGALAGLADRLEEALGLPVEPLQIGPVAAAGETNSPQYAAAYGLALAGMGAVESVDLLATETRRAAAARQRSMRRWVAAAACLLVLAGGAVWGYRGWKAHQAAAADQARVARTLAASEKVVQGLETRKKTLLTQVQAYRAALRPDHPWSAVLNEVGRLAPAGIWLTGIELERGKPMVLRGTALLPDQAADLAAALARSPMLQAVHLSYANDAVVAQRHVTQFGITAEVRGNLPETLTTESGRRSTTKSNAREKTAGESSAGENSER